MVLVLCQWLLAQPAFHRGNSISGVMGFRSPKLQGFVLQRHRASAMLTEASSPSLPLFSVCFYSCCGLWSVSDRCCTPFRTGPKKSGPAGQDLTFREQLETNIREACINLYEPLSKAIEFFLNLETPLLASHRPKRLEAVPAPMPLTWAAQFPEFERLLISYIEVVHILWVLASSLS